MFVNLLIVQATKKSDNSYIRNSNNYKYSIFENLVNRIVNKFFKVVISINYFKLYRSTYIL